MIKYGYFRALKKNSKLVTYITVAFEQSQTNPVEYNAGFAVCKPRTYDKYCTGTPYYYDGDKFKKNVGRNVAAGHLKKRPLTYQVSELDNKDLTLVLWSLLDSALADETSELPTSVHVANKRDLIRFGLDTTRDASIDAW